MKRLGLLLRELVVRCASVRPAWRRAGAAVRLELIQRLIPRGNRWTAPLRVGERVRVRGPLPFRVNTTFVGEVGTIDEIDRWGVGVRLDDRQVFAWFTPAELEALEREASG